MQPVTAYESFDGLLFRTAKECADHETHCRRLAEIVDKLPRFHRGSLFEKGLEYYQHDPEIFLAIRDDFFRYMNEIHDFFAFKHHIGVRHIDPYYIASISTHLRNKGDQESLMAWINYLGYIDSQFRQWSQTIFIDKSPEDAKPINP